MLLHLIAHQSIKRFYKYLFLFMFVGLLFLGVILMYYGKRTTESSQVGLADFVEAWTQKGPKRKVILKKHESRCRNILEQIFQSPFTSIRPDFLRYPKTGKNLELDGYNPDYQVAFEYQGVQHRKYCPGMFHETYDDFVQQQNRDAFKKKRCIEEGIHVFYIPDTVPYEKLEAFLVKEVEQWMNSKKDEGDDEVEEEEVQN